MCYSQLRMGLNCKKLFSCCQESIPPAYGGLSTGGLNRLAESMLGLLKRLQIRALISGQQREDIGFGNYEERQLNAYHAYHCSCYLFLCSSMCYGFTVLVRIFSLFAFKEQMWLFRKQVASTLNSAHTVTHSFIFPFSLH
jgi:hypothetical protein